MLDKNIQKTLQLVKQRCQQQGLSFTTKRCNVLRLMLKAEKALPAYDIVAAYHLQYGQKISPVSIYRMLDFLVAAQLVHKLSSSSQYAACTHITCRHAHEMPMFLICNQCSQVEEIGVKKLLPPALEKNMASTGFQLQDRQLELHGICSNCQNSQE